MEVFPMPPKNVGATLKQNGPDGNVKVTLKGKLSDIERNIIQGVGGSIYIADNFDTIYDENQQIQDNIEVTETRQRDELDTKLKLTLEMFTVKMEFLDARTVESGIDIVENLKDRGEQAYRLDDIQNQVGVLQFRLQ